MSYGGKLAAFITALVIGSFLIYAISPVLTFFLVSITGQGWLFGALRWILVILFWAIMVWKCLPKKEDQ